MGVIDPVQKIAYWIFYNYKDTESLGCASLYLSVGISLFFVRTTRAFTPYFNDCKMWD